MKKSKSLGNTLVTIGGNAGITATTAGTGNGLLGSANQPNIKGGHSNITVYEEDIIFSTKHGITLSMTEIFDILQELQTLLRFIEKSNMADEYTIFKAWDKLQNS